MSEEKTPTTDAEGAGSEKTEKKATEAKAATGKRKAAKKPRAQAGDAGKSAAEPKAKPAAKKPRTPRKPKTEAAKKAEDPPPVETKPAPRRSRGASEGQPAVVRARARYVRSSARKARLVCDQIRGKSVEDARAILAMTTRAVARDWSKLLESAVANAENNHELVGDELRIRSVTADEGPTLKRYRPRAMGRATRIRKRTSHLTILLTPKD
jgi:ribosomal protein L22